MTHPVIRRRQAQREKLIAVARSYAEQVNQRLPLEQAWVAGSVARGDFNVWSDIDVVLVTGSLPEDALERLDLFLDAPPGVKVVAYRPTEFDRALRRRDRLATEALSEGVDLLIPGSGR